MKINNFKGINILMFVFVILTLGSCKKTETPEINPPEGNNWTSLVITFFPPDSCTITTENNDDSCARIIPNYTVINPGEPTLEYFGPIFDSIGILSNNNLTVFGTDNLYWKKFTGGGKQHITECDE